MQDRFHIKYIILPAVALLIAVAILVFGKSTGKPDDPAEPWDNTGTPTPTGVAKEEADPALFSYEEREDGTLALMGFAEDFEEKYEAAAGDILGFENGRLLLPSEYEGKKVTEIGCYAFQMDERITEPVIPAGYVTIADYAFEGCTGIRTLTIPDGVKNILDCAFFGCSALETLVIPTSAKNIEDYAFVSCDSLSEVTIGITAGLDGIFGDSPVRKMILTAGSTVPEDAFYGFSSLETVVFETDISIINDYAFADCTALKNIELPENLMSIGANAFENCASLERIVIPGTVTFIGEFAFADCEGLVSLNIPASVVTIGRQAFDYCDKLTLTVTAGSEGEDYAINQEIPYITE